ncbi:phosphoglucosamine mutase [Psychroflexus lacisalsi]|jgi:phosphomannomutase|uniref:Phosphoglucosamine mutase n=1 Tax=Psychroflexus lacisalsi TaxID=503928 RepID=A0ABN1K8W6_9FLAO|nr:phosphoglucosamine mutase [Psychroflexus lacisalsi]MBZ9619608.1 phosphoglucosamine mutase [Psychroflexus lacisalsi]
MTLIKSISGIRGTIGGHVGDNLTPLDIVKFSAAYGQWIKTQRNKENYKVVVGRDARISGKMVQSLVMQTLSGMGIHVVDLELSTTPTVEVAVKMEHADGGIILTASHNPKQWNALKLLNKDGEFLNAEEGEQILKFVDQEDFEFAEIDDLGKITYHNAYIDLHIEEIIDLDLVEVDRIKAANIKVVVDAVNSTGGISIPPLLEMLGVEVVKLYCEPTGEFPHNPEPLAKHLTELSEKVKDHHADFGIAVDPDVDRLAFVDENGEMFGEEYTLVSIADYVLSRKKGATVSNLSSSRALRDITVKHGCEYFSSAVGEVNVVARMKEVNAVIGGEGNGGVIYPELHYGRDSLVGVALFLSLLTEKQMKVSELRQTYTSYYMAKEKIELTPDLNVDSLLNKIQEIYKDEDITTIDGVKIDFPENWVHLRKSNTEPIVRIYTEAKSQKEADELAQRFISELEELSK